MNTIHTPAAAPAHTAHLINSQQVIGADVYNHEGQKLGNIDSLLIDRHTGHARFAVMSFGGFLGMGERYHQLPWGGLAYDQHRRGYMINASRDALKAAPAFSRAEVDGTDHNASAARVDAYFASLHGFYSPEQQARRNSGMAEGATPAPMQAVVPG